MSHARRLGGALRRRLHHLVATLFALFAGANVAVQHAEQPIYVATALVRAPGEAVARDAGVLMWRDGPEIRPVTAPPAGHEPLPSWQGSLGPLPPWVTPFAPTMGWPVDAYMRPVAARQRPLTFCAEELRREAPAAVGEAVRALTDTWDGWLDVLPTTEDCAAPDIVLGVGAEDGPERGGCGTPLAIACAALLFTGNRPFVRVTLNRGMLLSNGYQPGERYWSVVHESKHAAGYGHTGAYGGEGHAHPHPSDLGYYCAYLSRPCDNPTGRPAREDWEDQPGHNTAWGLRLRADWNGPAPGPTPSPTPPPTPPPTPSPTPTPTPVGLQVWAHRDELTGRCPGQTRFGEWCVVAMPAPRVWVEWDNSGHFAEVRADTSAR